MSDWYQIENASLIVQVTSKGAEMKRLFSKDWHRELLWLGDEKVWNRSAPVLFPIVGKLKDDEYTFKDKTYKMSQHGFARDYEFKCTDCGATEIEFLLVATEESFKQYPFCFELRVRYKLEGSKLLISYFVKNDDRQDMYFSIGAHPAFETNDITKYEIRFEREEQNYFQLKNSLVDWKHPHAFNDDKLVLSPGLFKNDALIFKRLKSKYIELVDLKRSESIKLYGNTPFWGIWAKSYGPFVCIEPWYGVSDSQEHDKELENKNGIIELGEGEVFGFSYTIEMKYIGREKSHE